MAGFKGTPLGPQRGPYNPKATAAHYKALAAAAKDSKAMAGRHRKKGCLGCLIWIPIPLIITGGTIWAIASTLWPS